MNGRPPPIFGLRASVPPWHFSFKNNTWPYVTSIAASVAALWTDGVSPALPLGVGSTAPTSELLWEDEGGPGRGRRRGPGLGLGRPGNANTFLGLSGRAELSAFFIEDLLPQAEPPFDGLGGAPQSQTQRRPRAAWRMSI